MPGYDFAAAEAQVRQLSFRSFSAGRQKALSGGIVLLCRRAHDSLVIGRAPPTTLGLCRPRSSNWKAV